MRSWILGTLLCILISSLAWGQATARIHGVVQDQSSAVVPNATVKVTQTETGISRSTVTDTDGEYVFANLPLGPYRLDIQKEGFANAVQTGIILQVDSDPSLPMTLRPGATSETITVEATPSQVETSSVGIGSVIETQRILDLPLNGRQPTDLITLSGLAVQTGSSPTYTMATGVNISVAGGTSYSVQYNLDGASHLDTYVGTNMPLPFPEALQEFKLRHQRARCDPRRRPLRSYGGCGHQIRIKQFPWRCISSSSGTTISMDGTFSLPWRMD